MRRLGIKEELELEITNIKMQKIEEEKELKREDLIALANIGAIMENYDIPAKGEYKDYSFEVDENYKVTIINKLKGEKPTIDANIISTDSKTAVEIEVTTSISNGNIKSIEAINGAILKESEENTSTKKIFIANENKIYYFKTIADNDRTNVTSIKVNNIIEKPKIEIKNITYDSFTIEVTNNHNEPTVTEYKYYVNGTVVNENTTNTTFTVTGLQIFTQYDIYVEGYFGTEKLTSDTKKIRTQIGEGGLIAKDITLIGHQNWGVTTKDIANLPLSEYSKIKIIFSFTAGWDWDIGFKTLDGQYDMIDGSGIRGHHDSIPKTTQTYDILKDKEYTILSLNSSSKSAILQIDAIYLIK